MRLEELQVYQIAMSMGEKVWKVVSEWDSFSKNTIGKQWVRAADSIAANLSEGYGRYFYKENRQFCYYSRGSLQETKTFLKKSYHRHLIDQTAFNALSKELDVLSIKLNNYIKTIGNPEKKQGLMTRTKRFTDNP